ncbi:MAG: zinc ribbon domain-containing protein [Candidatus Solibacter sp.]|jgi:hypothetical protein
MGRKALMPDELLQNKRCSQCGEAVPSGFEFCGMCGAKLGTTPLVSKDSRERKLLEYDIGEAVTDRLLKWGKLAGGAVAAALAILALSLGFWGFTSISDFRKNIESRTEQIDGRAKAAISQIGSAEEHARSIIETSKGVEKDLDSARRVVAQVQKLRTDVDSLQTQVEGFYRTQIRELFGGHQNEGRYSGSQDHWVVILQKQPIPASLRVRCGAIELYPENYQLAGTKLTVRCSEDLTPTTSPGNQFSEQSFIEVLYHSRS